MTDESPVLPDDDNPEWTASDFDRGRPGSEVLPQAVLTAFGKKRGRPRLAKAKRAVSLRLDPEVLDYYKGHGVGWQSRINEVLRKAMGKPSTA